MIKDFYSLNRCLRIRMNLGNKGNKIKIWTALKDNFIKNNNKVEKKNKMLIE